MTEAITAEQKKARNAELKAKRDALAKSKKQNQILEEALVNPNYKKLFDELQETKSALLKAEKDIRFWQDRHDGVNNQLQEARKSIDNIMHTNEVLERIVTNRKV